MWNYIKSWFTIETEFTKKWIARFTILISIVILFYIILSQELLFLHIHNGLSKNICNLIFKDYGAVVKVCITGYSVTFVGSMIKAFMAKQQEEANKLKLQLSQEESETCEIEPYEEEEYEGDIEENQES